MMSMSGRWFFVVASEAITVGDQTIALPGIGAYLARATAEQNLAAVGWVVLTMTVVIILYDQLMFRPLVAWADKFRFEQTGAQTAPGSWFLDLLHRSRLFRTATRPVGLSLGALSRWRLAPQREGTIRVRPSRSAALDAVWFVAVAIAAAYAAWKIIGYVASGVGWGDVFNAAELGLFTLTRVVVLIAVASLIWVPIGVEIGLRPHFAEKIQPLAQFLAAFPANLLFPVFVVAIVRFHLNPDIWLSPLIILGTQWYILFNVIAGTMAYPNDFREAATNFHMRGWQWWRQVMLPGIFSYFVTGDYRSWRRVERQHRRGSSILGRYQDHRARPRSLYRREYGRGRLSEDRARHRRDVAARDNVQSPALAAALCLCGRAAAPRLRNRNGRDRNAE